MLVVGDDPAPRAQKCNVWSPAPMTGAGLGQRPGEIGHLQREAWRQHDHIHPGLPHSLSLDELDAQLADDPVEGCPHYVGVLMAHGDEPFTLVRGRRCPGRGSLASTTR